MIAYRVSALALAAALSLSAAASAQTPPPPQDPGAAAATGGGDQPWRMHREMREVAHMKALHDALNIRPDQETAFQAFTASMKPPEGQRQPGGPGHDRQDTAAMTTPERLDAMSHRMDERTARMHARFERHAAAVKAFYAALSPDQRRTLDALPSLMGRGMGMAMGGGRRGMDKPDMGMDHPGA